MERHVEDIARAADLKIKEALKQNEDLVQHVQKLQDKLDKTIPRRDATTIARMKMDDKKRAGKAAKDLFGLNSEAFKSKVDLDGKRPATTSKASKASASAKGKKGKNKFVAQSVLEKDAPKGTIRINLDSHDDFEIGHKVRIGDPKHKKTLEERWIVGHGSIILDSPLANAHLVGTTIVSLGPPTNAEQSAKLKRALNEHFIKQDVIFDMIVEPAMDEGEKIVADRAAQRKFEKRKVDKHIITARAALCQNISTTTMSATAAAEEAAHPVLPSSSLSTVSSLGKLITTDATNSNLLVLEEGYT
jgi:hypothetical protein